MNGGGDKLRSLTKIDLRGIKFMFSVTTAQLLS